MAEFIPKEVALSFPFANGNYDHEHADEHFINGCESYREWLEKIPAADVVEVVRCKHCKHWRGPGDICTGIGIDFDGDGFCSEGEMIPMAEYRELDALLAAVPAKYEAVIRALPAVDVVARDCYDRILAENDDLKGLLDTYGGEYGIAAAFEAKEKLEAGAVRGKWEYQTMTVPGGKGQTYAKWRCSACRKKSKDRSPFCPLCGADMRPPAE